jgi:hypothetical protein
VCVCTCDIHIYIYIMSGSFIKTYVSSSTNDVQRISIDNPMDCNSKNKISPEKMRDIFIESLNTGIGMGNVSRAVKRNVSSIFDSNGNRVFGLKFDNDLNSSDFTSIDNDSKLTDDERIMKKGDLGLYRFMQVMSRAPGFHLFDLQLHLAKFLIDCALPVYYYDVWINSKIRILKRFGLSDYKPFLIAISARREGKSVFVILMIIALLLTAPPRMKRGIAIGLVSLNFKLSKIITERIIGIMNKLPEIFTEDLEINSLSDEIRVRFKDGRQASMCALQGGEVIFHLVGIHFIILI